MCYLGLGKISLDLPADLSRRRSEGPRSPHDVLDVRPVRHRSADVLVKRSQVQDSAHPVHGADHGLCDGRHHVLRGVHYSRMNEGSGWNQQAVKNRRLAVLITPSCEEKTRRTAERARITPLQWEEASTSGGAIGKGAGGA